MGWSGLWNGLASTTVATSDYTLNSGRSPNRYHLARIMRKRNMKELAEVMSTLNGVAAGETASHTYSRVQAERDLTANVQGGSRTIETKELVGPTLADTYDASGANTSRATVAGDQTTINELLLGTGEGLRKPTTYPTDTSGNGGGGKGEGAP